jgi:hypothetical protein
MRCSILDKLFTIVFILGMFVGVAMHKHFYLQDFLGIVVAASIFYLLRIVHIKILLLVTRKTD